MVDMFEEKICNYCKTTTCEKKIKKSLYGDVVIYKCKEYEKDKSKIVPYERPLIVTAERKNIKYAER